MNKRGSHVDVIISFIIFVTFIVFIYILLQPTLTITQTKESLANSLEIELINNLSAGNSSNLTISSQTINDTNIIQLIEAYNQNYNSVKNWFNLSASDNFGFNFTYQNQTTIGTNDEPPKFSNIYSQAFSVLYITNNSLQSGLLTIRVW